MPATNLRLSGLVSGLAVTLVAGLLVAPALADARDPWPDLARDVFEDRPLADGGGFLAVEMPARAEDAAIVPVTIRATLPAGDARAVKTLTLVIDENPAPVAATFTIGGTTGSVAISTRVRVDAYTNVHVVAELSDGTLHVVKTHVKASGGCSAPAAKNADVAAAGLGRMRFRQFAAADAAPASRLREAQIMIRHPNSSGLQMDQVTRLYTPAHFVQTIKVWQGEDLVFAMEGGISIAEDPNIRFTYVPNGARTFRVEARDTDDRTFSGEFLADVSAM